MEESEKQVSVERVPLNAGLGECGNFCEACARRDDKIEQMSEALHKISAWQQAYPVSVFPEPDFKRAAEVLKAAGMTLDAISASNMRHVLNGIKGIIDTAMLDSSNVK
jgi:hypothetical protein